MSVLATFSVPSESFVLGDALQVDAIERIEFERVVPSRHDIMPYFWVWGSNLERFETVVEDEPEIASITRIDTVDEGGLYRVEWDELVTGFIDCVQRTDAMLVEGHGMDRNDGDEWWFELRFPDRTHVEAFHEICEETELGFDLRRIFSIQEHTREQAYDLTEKQRETLAVAAANGYFDEPRSISTEELASTFDVTPAAISGRLRRAERTLIENTVLDRSPQ